MVADREFSLPWDEIPPPAGHFFLSVRYAGWGLHRRESEGHQEGLADRSIRQVRGGARFQIGSFRLPEEHLRSIRLRLLREAVFFTTARVV